MIHKCRPFSFDMLLGGGGGGVVGVREPQQKPHVYPCHVCVCAYVFVGARGCLVYPCEVRLT